MWEIDIVKQAVSFVEAVCLGMIFCLCYDFLRSVQIFLNMKTFLLLITDSILAFLCAFVAFCFLLSTTLGEIRFYIILGIGLGFLIFRKTVSRFVVGFLTKILDLIGKFKFSISLFFRKIFEKNFSLMKTITNKCDFFIKIKKTKQKRLEKS